MSNQESQEEVEVNLDFLVSNRFHIVKNNEEDQEIAQNFIESNSLNHSILFLQSLWKTEENSPEILPYNQEIVDEIRKILEEQQEFLNKIVNSSSSVNFFTINIYQMDIDRIRYVLLNYLRCRIKKIEKSVEFFLENNELKKNLSLDERIFLSKINNLSVQHYENTLYNRIKEDPRQLFIQNEERVLHATPNLDVSLTLYFYFIEFCFLYS